MNWNKLSNITQLDEIVKESHHYPILIFKHSTRCSISATALGRLERHWQQAEVGDLKPYYLDLIVNRPISNQIAEQFDVWHESPQVLLIRNGESIFDTSHYDISFETIKSKI